MSERAWAEVDLDAIAHNVEVLRRTIAPAELLAVVKADGYGHGAGPVAAAAIDAGASMLGVAITDEGVALRDAGIEARVLVLSEPRPEELVACVAFRLEPTLYTAAGIRSAAEAAADHGKVLAVHLKVDTGMHRVGAAPADAVELADAIAAEPSLELASVFTHCAVADEPDDPYTGEQLARFHEVLRSLADHGHRPPLRHAANSAGGLLHPTARLDLVRAGIAIYGIAPAPDLAAKAASIAELRPALALKAAVSLVKVVAAGERLSYGLRHTFAADTVVATVPIGYADGVARRSASVGAEVLLGGRRRPIVGTVTMDQLMVDCGPPGASDEPAVGDEVVLIGRQGELEITAEEVGGRLDTIGYEVVCAIGARIPRRYATGG
jgi:alanine racemase